MPRPHRRQRQRPAGSSARSLRIRSAGAPRTDVGARLRSITGPTDARDGAGPTRSCRNTSAAHCRSSSRVSSAAGTLPMGRGRAIGYDSQFRRRQAVSAMARGQATSGLGLSTMEYARAAMQSALRDRFQPDATTRAWSVYGRSVASRYAVIARRPWRITSRSGSRRSRKASSRVRSPSSTIISNTS